PRSHPAHRPRRRPYEGVGRRPAPTRCRSGAALFLLAGQRREPAERRGRPLIACVGLATRDTIYAVPRHPGADERVVATQRVVAGGGPAATAAVAIARLGVEARFVGGVDGEVEGGDVVQMPGRSGE